METSGSKSNGQHYNSTVKVRFAPSPTGYLHIGSARTALFNYLFARHYGGEYLLRIEDTDRARSTNAAVEQIMESLEWLGLMPDAEPVFQTGRENRHREVAEELVRRGKAYLAYDTPDELTEIRKRAETEKRTFRYDGTRWKDGAAAPFGIKPVIRIRAPETGSVTLHDSVQGDVTVPSATLDDMIILRSDGTPTYLHAVVVDDHDMGITHVIRGDDHLTNTFRQFMVYDAMEWKKPEFGHMPMIHAPDNTKLSKRHGAVSVLDFRNAGILPEALCNYLMRLGWGHGNEEFLTRERAIELFTLRGVGKAAAKMDEKKLASLNAMHIRNTPDKVLAEGIAERAGGVSKTIGEKIERMMPSMKIRAHSLAELDSMAGFLVENTPVPENAAARIITDSHHVLGEVSIRLMNAAWTETELNSFIVSEAARMGIKPGAIAQPLRACLTGKLATPPLNEVMVALGRGETLRRIRHAILRSDYSSVAPEPEDAGSPSP